MSHKRRRAVQQLLTTSTGASGAPYARVFEFRGQQTNEIRQAVDLTAVSVPVANHCDWSPDGRFLLSANGTLDIWFFDRGRLRGRVSNPPTVYSDVCDAAFSPNGRWLALALNAGPRIAVFPFDLARGRFLGDKFADPAVLPGTIGFGVGWSPDSAYVGLTTINSPRCQAYTFSDAGFGGARLEPAVIHATGMSSIRWAANGAVVVCTGNTTSATALRVYPWAAGFGTAVTPSGFVSSTLNGGAWSPDGAWYATTGSSLLQVCPYDGSTLGAVISPPDGLPNSGNVVAWSPDGTMIAVAHNSQPFLTIYAFSNGIFQGKRFLPRYFGPLTLSIATLRCAWRPVTEYT